MEDANANANGLSVREYIAGLEGQLEELRTLLSHADEAKAENKNARSAKELQDLKIENEKLKFRIRTLMRTVEEKESKLVKAGIPLD